MADQNTEEELIETLQGTFTGNEKTEFGSAYHAIIEGNYKVGEDVEVFCDGKAFTFTQDQAEPAFEYRKQHPSMIHEMAVQKVVETNFGPIQLTARVDGIEGQHVRDIKTRFRNVVQADYTDSIQWKAYLMMLDLDVFFYDVFEVKHFETQYPVQIVYHEPIPCIRYEGMQDEVYLVLNTFLEYIENRNFWHLLKPAIEVPEFIF